MNKLPVLEGHKPSLTDDTKWVRVDVKGFADEHNTLERLIPLFREFENTNPDIPITPERTVDSFGADSLDTVELIMAVEDEFGLNLEDPDLDACKTIADLVTLIEKELAKC